MRDRNTALNCFNNPEVILNIELGPALYKLNMRAEYLCFSRPASSFDSVSLGFVAGGNTTSVVYQRGHYANRSAPQFRLFLLLNGSKIGIQIQKQPLACGACSFLEEREGLHRIFRIGEYLAKVKLRKSLFAQNCQTAQQYLS